MAASDNTSFFLRAASVGAVLGLLGFIALELSGNQPSGTHHGYRHAIARAAPAVVSVYSERQATDVPGPNSPLFDEFFGGGRSARIQTTLGSGVVLDDEGHVVTNHHVIAGSERIEVVLGDGRRLPAERVGSDPDTDLALLRVETDGLTPIPRVESRALARGDVVLAIGNPWGVGQAATLGIVGATGRGHLGLSTFEDFIQHDAAINPGSSGGALVNPAGELVGINTAIFSRTGGSHGIGFAIPVDLVMDVSYQLREHGHVIRGWLGVDTRDLSASRAPGDTPGVRVEGVFAGSPADQAGLQKGDVLLSIDGSNLTDVETLLRATTSMRPGERVTVTYRRDGAKRTTEAVLAQRPTSR